jgi:hypothetical protein
MKKVGRAWYGRYVLNSGDIEFRSKVLGLGTQCNMQWTCTSVAQAAFFGFVLAIFYIFLSLPPAFTQPTLEQTLFSTGP